MLARSVGNDIDVIFVHFHIPPDGIGSTFCFGQVTEVNRVIRVGNFDEGHSVGPADQREVAFGGRMSPSPNIIHSSAAHTTNVSERKEGLDIHVVAAKAVGIAVGALYHFTGERVHRTIIVENRAGLGPAVPRFVVDKGGSF